MISFKSRGDFKKTEKFLKRSLGIDYKSILDKYGKLGVESLASHTPKDTGLLASSWRYYIEKKDGYYAIVWCNDDIENGENIALIVQYGHGTRSGTWVEGRDYINPSLRPIFDELAKAAWKEVTKL